MQRAAAQAKQQDLVTAAAGLFHEQGVAKTTLTDVARAANIPLGSVFYYFKTKDDLVSSVIDRREDGIARLISRHQALSDPRARLLALVQIWVEDREVDALFGCPIGSLCFELARTRGPLSDHAAQPFRLLLDWCEEQFRLLGAEDASGRSALHLVSALQGISLIAAVFADPEMIVTEAGHLREWLQTV